MEGSSHHDPVRRSYDAVAEKYAADWQRADLPGTGQPQSPAKVQPSRLDYE
jgi:hypothetical protein